MNSIVIRHWKQEETGGGWEWDKERRKEAQGTTWSPTHPCYQEMSRQSRSNLNASPSKKVFRRGPVTITHWTKKVDVSKRDLLDMKDQLRNNIHSTTTELDHGSLASIKTQLWTQRFLGESAHSQPCCCPTAWRCCTRFSRRCHPGEASSCCQVQGIS